MARHRRGCQGGDRLPTYWNPHSPSVDMEPQASCEQMEGCECVAPSVPNHGEHTVSRRKRSGSSEEPEQRCQGVSPQHFSIPALSSTQNGRTEG